MKPYGSIAAIMAALAAGAGTFVREDVELLVHALDTHNRALSQGIPVSARVPPPASYYAPFSPFNGRA